LEGRRALWPETEKGIIIFQRKIYGLRDMRKQRWGKGFYSNLEKEVHKGMPLCSPLRAGQHLGSYDRGYRLDTDKRGGCRVRIGGVGREVAKVIPAKKGGGGLYCALTRRGEGGGLNMKGERKKQLMR